VFNGDTAYITQLKQQKMKKVLLLRSTLTLWRRAAKVISPFWFLLFYLCDVGRVAVKHSFKLLSFFTFILIIDNWYQIAVKRAIESRFFRQT